MSSPLQGIPTLEVTFARLREQAPLMAATSAAERLARLRRLKRAIQARRKAIAIAIHEDFARPEFETELSEIHHVIAEIDHAVKLLPRWMRGERVATSALLIGTSSRVHYEARGVVLIMAPWNYPFGLLFAPLVAAIAAGNCVVLKPSEKTPRIAAIMAELVSEACDPAEVVLVEGGAEVANALTQLPFDHFFFTGSTAIGKIVMAAAAKHLATVTLELGGKSPAIVHRDTDVLAAADRIVWGRFFNAGQTCLAPDYVLVHESQEQAFLEAAKGALARQYGETEAARATSTDLARIVDTGHFNRLRGMIEGSVAAGAKVVTGAEYDESTRYIAPTILSEVSRDMPVMAEEIFGPILPVLRYQSLEVACREVRAGGKPLAMYIFADDIAAKTIIGATSAGATIIGNTLLHYASPNLPFGGVGESGSGSYHGVHGFLAFSHARAVVRQRTPALAGAFHPPYRGRVHELARRFLRWLE